jgi:hypothetical protein
MRKIDDIFPDIGFLPALVLTIVFGIVFQIGGNWMLMFFAGALGALFVRFLGIGLAWALLFVYLSITAQAMAVANMFIGLLGLEGLGAVVIVISVLIGALLGGFGGMLGRSLFELIDEFIPSGTTGEQVPSSKKSPVEEKVELAE